VLSDIWLVIVTLSHFTFGLSTDSSSPWFYDLMYLFLLFAWMDDKMCWNRITLQNWLFQSW
jgi:hypothetical protein